MPPLPTPSPGPYKVQEDRGSSEPLPLSQEEKDQFEQIRDKVLQALPEFHPYAHQLKPTKFRQSSIGKRGRSKSRGVVGISEEPALCDQRSVSRLGLPLCRHRCLWESGCRSTEETRGP